MSTNVNKTEGSCLFAGSTLMIATMILHPAGGTTEHILKIQSVSIISHSLAIFSLPFIAFGFRGLASRLESGGSMSWFGFILICTGLLAAMFSAILNGIALPLFLERSTGINPDVVNAVRMYGESLARPLEYILLAAFSSAIFLWSILILRYGEFPKWAGLYGVSLIFLGVLSFGMGMNFLGLTGFRIFIFGISSWILILSGYMWRQYN